MKHGAEWYKRKPTAYLGGVQGLSSKEHAVFSIVLDLIYQHGGSVNNDPAWIAGWISDMGAAAVRTAIASLIAREKLTLIGGQLSNKRAAEQAETKEKLREVRAAVGRIGGKSRANPEQIQSETRVKPQQNCEEMHPDLDGGARENNDLTKAIAPPREEKRREEKKEEGVEKSARETRRATTLPANWTPSPRNLEDATARDFSADQIDHEADRFRDYHHAKGTKFKDWDAGWRTWLGNARKFAATGNARTGSPHQAMFEGFRRAAFRDPRAS